MSQALECARQTPTGEIWLIKATIFGRRSLGQVHRGRITRRE